MKIKLIDLGIKEGWRPYRPHGNDAGADVYMPYDCTLRPGEIEKVLLGFGIEVPADKKGRKQGIMILDLERIYQDTPLWSAQQS